MILYRKSGHKSVKNAPKRLKARLLNKGLNLRRGQLGNKNAYPLFLYEKFAKKCETKKYGPRSIYIGYSSFFLQNLGFSGNFFLATTFRV